MVARYFFANNNRSASLLGYLQKLEFKYFETNLFLKLQLGKE